MKLIGPSSVLVTWDDQVADTFYLWLRLDTNSDTGSYYYHVDDITGMNYTYTELPSSSRYLFFMGAVFGGKRSSHSDQVIITIDCKLPASHLTLRSSD